MAEWQPPIFSYFYEPHIFKLGVPFVLKWIEKNSSVCSLDREKDGSSSLVCINDHQILRIIQGKLSRLFRKYRYLIFSRKSPCIENECYPDDIFKINDTFEFTKVRDSK